LKKKRNDDSQRIDHSDNAMDDQDIVSRCLFWTCDNYDDKKLKMSNTWKSLETMGQVAGKGGKPKSFHRVN